MLDVIDFQKYREFLREANKDSSPIPVVHDGLGPISEDSGPLCAEYAWDQNGDMALLDPNYVSGTGKANRPHVCLGADGPTISASEILAAVFDSRGHRSVKRPGSLLYRTFQKRRGYGSGVRWQAFKEWERQFLFSTGLIRLANDLGLPILMASLTIPHNGSWSPPPALWASAMKRFNQVAERAFDRIGGAVPIRFTEWSASFQNGVHKGVHILYVFEDGYGEFQYGQNSGLILDLIRQKLTTSWVDIVNDELDRHGAPGSVVIDPSRAADVRLWVDENGDPWDDTSYFFKDKDVHGGRSKAKRSQRRSFGVQDLERMSYQGDQEASLLLQDMRTAMYRRERMTLDRRTEMLLGEFWSLAEKLSEAKVARRHGGPVQMQIFRELRDAGARVRSFKAKAAGRVVLGRVALSGLHKVKLVRHGAEGLHRSESGHESGAHGGGNMVGRVEGTQASLSTQDAYEPRWQSEGRCAVARDHRGDGGVVDLSTDSATYLQSAYLGVTCFEVYRGRTKSRGRWRGRPPHGDMYSDHGSKSRSKDDVVDVHDSDCPFERSQWAPQAILGISA